MVVKLARKILDVLAVFLIAAGAPLFRALGRWPANYPAYLRQADRSGVHFRATHYYNPIYRDIDLPNDVSSERDLPGLDLRGQDQLRLLETWNFDRELSRFTRVNDGGLDFSHENGAYSYGDAEALYAMLRTVKPAHFIEVGSGFSTRVVRAAIEENQNEHEDYTCRHICVEPYEADWLERLDVELIRERVEHCDPAMFDQLQSGDILFIDSSHVIRPFGDVLFLYQRVLPRLKSGVIVHVHDIFTPKDYPEAWLREERRLWNEQYLLEALFAHSSRYKVLLALNWLKHNYPDPFYRALPAASQFRDHEPGAFWFEVR